MKKIIVGMMIFFALLFVLPMDVAAKETVDSRLGKAVSYDGELPTHLQLSETEIVIALGETYSLTIKNFTTPSNYYDFRWMSDKPAIASINKSGEVGNVTGKSLGTTTIRVSYGGLIAECKVTVMLADITGAKVARSSDTALKISWAKVPSASGYVVYRSSSAAGTYKAIATITKGTTVSYTNSKLKNGTTYYYKIKAYKTVNGKKIYGKPTSALVGVPLKTPTITVARKDFNHIKISWKKIPAASGYEILRSDTKSGTYSVIGTAIGNGTVSYDDKTAVTNKTYYYKVRAYKEISAVKFNGAGSAIKSTKATLGTPKLSITITNSNNIITLSWPAVNGADKYVIYRSTSEKGTYTVLHETTSTKHEDWTVLTTGTVYYYKVRAKRVVGSSEVYSGYSATIGYTTLARSTISSVNKASDTSLKMSWSKVNSASGYVIYRSTSETGTYSAVKTITSGNTLSYTDTKLKAGMIYYYKVRAYKTISGKKVYSYFYSNPVGGVLLKAPAITVTTASYNSIKVAWKKVAGASVYEIYGATSKSGPFTNVFNIWSSDITEESFYPLVFNKTYYYKVRVCTTVTGVQKCGPYSEVKSAKTALLPPKINSVNTQTPGVQLLFDYNYGTTESQVYRSTSANGTYTLVGTTTSGFYADTNVKSGTSYYYKVRAGRLEGSTVIYGGYSAVKGTVWLQTPVLDGFAYYTEKGEVLKWSQISGATGYEIHRTTNGGTELSLIATITKNTTISYTDASVVKGGNYQYRIIAYKTVEGKKYYSSYHTFQVTVY